MKFKSFFVAALAALTITSCSNEDEVDFTPGGDDAPATAAYMSLRVQLPVALTRNSGEIEGSTEEGKVNKLYAITFDSYNNVIAYTGEAEVKEMEIGNGHSSEKPEAILVSSKAKGLLLIANPGAKLDVILNNISVGDSFDDLNEQISAIDLSEITGSAGFTMINSGNEGLFPSSDLSQSHSDATLCLVDITDKVQYVDETAYSSTAEAEAAAKDAAEKDENRVKVGIERLSAKVLVKEKDGGATVEDDAKFTFVSWTLDVHNTILFPWARKVALNKNHIGSYYSKNFYTIDPNYITHTGLEYNDPMTYVVDEDNDLWALKEESSYSVENTMKAIEQKFKNATRVVVKAEYFPHEDWEENTIKDWFAFRDTAYENLEELQKAYEYDKTKLAAANLEGPTALMKACINFYDVLKAYADDSANGINFPATVTKFEELDESTLALFTYGGEIIRVDNCIRWFKDGINYYWYEIRHDATITEHMNFGKYGVVRNNFYTLTVNSVSKWGTPWYPNVDPTDPTDPDGPDPTDPIDQIPGYLGVSVEVAPWITWEHEINW